MTTHWREARLPDQIARAAHDVIEALIRRDYVRAERLCKGVRLKAPAIEQAVNEYGGSLCTPPGDLWQHLDVVQVMDVLPRTFSVNISLWTQEEGKSDLTLELTLVEEGEAMTIQIDGLHVL